jgi:Family of unknown function (DUF5682)
LTVHLFGIRHHGPGSARSLLRALTALKPDRLLIEGPPDANAILPLARHPDLTPPVALLVYTSTDTTRDRDRSPQLPQSAQSVYYPFAVFSPEWQALQYGLAHDIPVQFADLPQAHRLAIDLPEPPAPKGSPIAADPLGALATAAGYEDGERWWEQTIEHRQDSTQNRDRDCLEVFTAIAEAMTALRQEARDEPNPLDRLREAFMRQAIRQAQKAGSKRLAVVCGAWHIPALAHLPPAKDDRALLQNLPKLPIAAAWIPWTYSRLSRQSGYGAGIESPGWYHHLWEQQPDVAPENLGSTQISPTLTWMVQVAQLLRQEGFEASSAQTIESVRLAESLAALRDRALPGLTELKEAAQTVLCFGSEVPMRIIHDRAIVSDRMGTVPADAPIVPLQRDLHAQCKRLRLSPEPTPKAVTFDLRQPTDRDRSHLLHRLNWLNIPWGQIQRSRGLGTFKEAWLLQWKPEFALAAIEAAVWGNTVLEAATARAIEDTQHANTLPQLTEALDRLLLAELPQAIDPLIDRLQAIAAVTADVAHLMEALPPLARILRYGNVRQTDTQSVAHIVDELVTRSCIGLPDACTALNDEASGGMYARMLHLNSAIALLQNPAQLRQWYATLDRIAQGDRVHGVLVGGCCRWLLDAEQWDEGEAQRRMGLALSPASESTQAAAWIEGFLMGSGLLLVHDTRLLAVVDRWVRSLTDDAFIQILPLLRRTFATFEPAERRQIGEKLRGGSVWRETRSELGCDGCDLERADRVLPMIAGLLGLRG